MSVAQGAEMFIAQVTASPTPTRHIDRWGLTPFNVGPVVILVSLVVFGAYLYYRYR